MSALPRIDKLEIQSTLGRGAMGVVYKAHDPFMDRCVAVKMLRTDLLDGTEREDFLRRFRGEAKAYGRLLHPNIVTCYSYNEGDGQAYIVMEYVEGRTLKEHLDRGIRFALPQVRDITVQLLGALAYAHAHGVVHRDIKPANVMLTAEGRIKVTDFGIARVEANTTTHTKHVVGSPSYMSPEQFSGKSVDARTDIYSAGLVIYELLTGERPFPNSDLGTALYNVLYSEPQAPSRRNTQVGVALDRAVLKALQKDPEARYRNAEEFIDALERCFSPRPVPSQQDVAPISPDETQVVSESSASSPPPSPLQTDGPPPGEVTRESGGGETFPAPREGSKKAWLWGGGAVVGVAAALAFVLSGERDLRPESAAQSAAGQESTAVAVPSASPSPQPDHQAIVTALQGFACADVVPTVSGGDVLLSGFVATADDVGAAQRAVVQVPGVERVSSSVRVIAWPYCELVALLHPRRGAGQGAPPLPDEGQVVRFKEGNPLTLDLKTPPHPAYLYVDYFLLDGQVVHLVPNELQKDNRVAPDEVMRIGEPGPGKRHWEVSPPFGREMITIIASREPLPLSERPEVESAREYVRIIEASLAGIEPGDVSTNYTFIETEP